MKTLGRLLLPRLGPPIILLGRADAGVPGELLNHRDVRACVEQVTDERPPHVVRRELFDAGLIRAAMAREIDGVARH